VQIGTMAPIDIVEAQSEVARNQESVIVAEAAIKRAQDNLLGRWAEPREVAFPILFLACDESSFVTGATLMVDAGRSIL